MNARRNPLKDIEKAKRQVPKDEVVVNEHKKQVVDDGQVDPKSPHFSGIRYF